MMVKSVGVSMQHGVLCQVVQEVDTGRYHYYPIKAHPVVYWDVNGIQIDDMYLYVDYEDEK